MKTLIKNPEGKRRIDFRESKESRTKKNDNPDFVTCDSGLKCTTSPIQCGCDQGPDCDPGDACGDD